MGDRIGIEGVGPKAGGHMGRLAPYGALALRVSLAVVFLAHALLKLLVFTLPGTAAWFALQGFPGWTAYPVFVIELGGAILLALGLHSRAAAVALLPVMLGALAVHAGNGWAFTSPNGGWEYPALVIALLVAHALLGPGALAVTARRAAPERADRPVAHGA